MPIKLNFIEKLGLLKLNKGPGPLIDVLGALSFKAIITSFKLNIFEILDKAPLTAKELAKKTNSDENAITLLLETLESIGYLNKKNNLYNNSSITSKWLVKSSPSYIAGLFNYFDDALQRWEYLDKTITQGKTPMQANEWLDKHPGKWDRYHEGMLSIANIFCNKIVSKIKLPENAKRLLDLGGSHGLHSIKFCQKHPSLSATIFDLECARKTAEDAISKNNMTKQITFKDGDFLTDDIGSNYDAILLFNTIRIFTPDIFAKFSKRIFEALNKNGKLIILDQLDSKKHKSKFTKANTNLILLELFNSTNGHIYTPDDIYNILSNSGFNKIKTIKLRRSPGIGLITAEKK